MIASFSSQRRLKVSLISTIALITLPALALTGCMRSENATSVESGSGLSPTGEVETEAAATITVTNLQGSPLANARVMIGPRENVPFPGNLVTTDKNGQFKSPSAWTTAQPVTIEAPGHILTTFFALPAQSTKLKVKAAPIASENQKYEVKGVVGGYGPLPKDGILNVGMISPTLSRSEINMFRADSMVSSETDRISVIGQTLDIPSNLSIPKQTENYVLPITLNKPQYRVYFSKNGRHKIASTHVRFPFKYVTDQMRKGTPMIELIDHFEFIEASIKTVTVSETQTKMDLVVNDMKLSPQVSVVAPNFTKGQTMVSMSMAEIDDQYFVADAKSLKPGEKKTLAAPASGAAKGLILSILGNANPESFSTVTSTASDGSNIEFLPITSSPQLRSKTLVLNPPSAAGTKIKPMVTYAVLSMVEVIDKGSFKLEKKTPQWELYASDWASSLELPDFPASSTSPAPAPTRRLRWQAAFGGQSGATGKPAPGPGALEEVSHVTHSALDL